MVDTDRDWLNLLLKDHKYKNTSAWFGGINNHYCLSNMYSIILKVESVPTNKFRQPDSGSFIFLNVEREVYALPGV